MGTKTLTLLFIWILFLQNVYSQSCNEYAPRVRDPYCCNGQMKTEIVTATSANDSCKFDYRLSLETPKCQKKKDIEGICERYRGNKFACIAEDTIYLSKLDSECNCVNEAIKQPRTCCCKDPSTYTTCDKDKGTEETIATDYQLSKDENGYSCKATESRTRSTIIFPTEYSSQGSSCNKEGYQTIVTTKTYLDGCQIKSVIDRTDTMACSCSTNKRTVETCNGDYELVTKTFDGFLSCCECSCICEDRLLSVKRRIIECPMPTVQRSDCRSKNLIVTSINYKLKDCRCIQTKEEHSENCEKCEYKELNRTVDPCCECKDTETVTIIYKDSDCSVKTKSSEQPCSCSNPPPSTRTSCDNGDWITVNTKTEFDYNLRQCIPKSTSIVKRETCNPKTSTIGICGQERKYYKKVTTVEDNVNPDTCKCEKSETVKYIICECPTNEETKWQCDQNDHRVRTLTTYVMNIENNICYKKVNKEDKMVTCEKAPAKKIVKTSVCDNEEHTYTVDVINCECKISDTSRRVVTSCPCPPKPPLTTDKCVNDNTLVTTHTSYQKSCDNTECLPILSESSQTIVCNNYLLTSTTPCENGEFFKINEHFGVKQCKCVRMKVDRIKVSIACNTANPVMKQICQGDKWVLTTTSWAIINCQCIESSKCVHKPIDCAPSTSQESKCNYETRLITVTTIKYDVINCKCTPKKKIRKIPCRCLREDKIERSKCFGKKRIVSLMRYEEVGKTCQWMVIKTESEDCECCKDTSVDTCQGKSILTTKTSYSLVLHKLILSVERCVKRTDANAVAVVCNKDYTYRTPCKNNKQSVISCTYKVVNCKCSEICKTECVRACDCRLKNECETKCINNVMHNICYKYRNNGPGCGCGCRKDVSECAKNRNSHVIPISCVQPVPRRTCTECDYYHDNGYYKKCTTLTREKENCKCQLKSKTKEVLCRCKEPSTSSICRNNQRVLITTAYLKIQEKCIQKISELEIKINCPKSYIITKDQACHTEYVLVYYKKVDCRCVEKRRTKSNDKCCKKSFVVKTCSVNNWLFTKHSWIQRKTIIKLFNKISDSPMKTFCEEVIKKTPKVIICLKESSVTWCNVKTKRLHTILTYYAKVNCVCTKKSAEKQERCKKCKRKREDRGKCDNSNLDDVGYLDLTTTTHKVTERNTCKRHIKHTKEICRCPRPRYREFCRNGKWISEEKVFLLRAVPICKMQVTEKAKSIHCYNNGKPNPWIAGEIDKCRRPGEYTIANFDREDYKDCSCTKSRKKVKIGICCKPTRYVKKCIGNRIVLVTICEHAEGLRCIVTKHSVSSPVVCLPPIKKLIGKPVKCVQKFVLTTFINKNCHCIPTPVQDTELTCCLPKRTVKRTCEGARWKITTTTFRLEKGKRKCIPNPKVTYKYLCTCSLDHVTTKDTKAINCTFIRSYYKKKIVNCQYQDYLTHKEPLKSCCLPVLRTTTKCKKDRIWVKTEHSFLLSNFRCIPRSKRSEKEIDCSRLVLEERVETGLCQVKDTYYAAVYKKCRCERRIVRVEPNNEICCCHKKPYTTTRCNRRKGIITTSHYTFHLRNKRCIKCAKHSSVHVNCNRKDCHTIVGPCVKDTNVVKLICLRRNKCKCVRKIVNQGNQCCKPVEYQWKVFIRCRHPNDPTFIKRIEYYAFRLDKDRQFCKPVVIKVQKKLCRCKEKNRILKVCINHTVKKITTITYKLNEGHDACIRRVSEHLKNTVGCCIKKRKLRIVSRQCDARTGWSLITTEYVHAANCKCIKTRKVKRCPCICKVAFPTQVRVYCKNNQIITETKTAICKHCRVRWTVNFKSTQICNCEKIVTEKGNCYPMRDGYAVSIRYNSKIEYKSINCKCLRKEILRWKVHCECRKMRQVTTCQISQILITTHLYVKKNRICRHIATRKVIKVPCPSIPKITISKCRNNKYEIRTQTFYYCECKCVYKTARQQCDCKCPSNTKRKRCTGNYLIEIITTSWAKKNCRCVKTERRRLYTPKCPKYVKTTVGLCVKKGNSGFKRIIHRSLSKRSDICKCLLKEKSTYECCWCKENPKIIKFCRNNNVEVTQTSKRQCSTCSKTCRRTIVTTCAKTIAVPKTIVTYYCSRKTGRDMFKTISYHISDCKPKPTITKDRGFCDCPKEWKRISKGKCNVSTDCMRTDTYIRKQLERRRCKDVKEYKTVRCCCNPKLVKKIYCKNNQIYNSVTTCKLVRHVSIPIESITIQQVVCSTKIVVEKSRCQPNGYKIIRKYGFFNRNCKCVKEKVKEFQCKCKCKKESVKYYCDKVARVSTKKVTTFFIIHCKCKAKIALIKRCIQCPVKSIVISKCIHVPGKDYSIRTTTTTTYSVNDKCKCVRKIDIYKEICHCDRKETVRKDCDKRRHLIIIETSYRILQNKGCVTEKCVKKHSVCCGTGRWVLKGDSGCIANNRFGRQVLTYVRQRAVGCRCKEESKCRVCDCLCNGPLKRSQCDKNSNEIVHTYYSYKLIRCKCVVTEKVQRERIPCAALPPILQPCRPYRHGVFRKYTIHRNRKLCQCQCVTIPKKTWIICRCPRQLTVHKCDKTKNAIVSTRIWYIMKPWKCIKQREITSKPVPCDTTPDCSVHSKCTGSRKSRQIHKCIVRTLSDCKCKENTKLVERPCRCKRTRKDRGSCNRITCRRIITTTKYYLVVLRNNQTKCVPHKTAAPERCCCRRKPTKKITCHNNKKIKTTVSYVFNEKCKTCHKVVREINITPQCCPAKAKIVGECPSKTTCNQVTHVTKKSLKNCKCIVTKHSYTKKCCCQKSFTVTTCTSDNSFKLTTHTFTLIRGKCPRTIKVVLVKIYCPRRISHYETPCNPKTRIQKKVITTYKLIKCNCLKIVTRKDEICKCLDRSSNEVCIASTGVFRKTVVSYELDKLRHRCIESKEISERRPCCDTTPIKKCEECKVSHHCGTYKRCTTTFGVRIGCSCVYRSQINFELCTCPRSIKYQVCVKHNAKITIVTYYIRVPTKDIGYDRECLKKSKVVKTLKICCPLTKVIKGACIKRRVIYTKYSYVALNCACTLRVKSFKVPCGCKRSKVVSLTCVRHFQTVVIRRYYKLICDSRRLIPRCKCIHWNKRFIYLTVCPPRYEIIEKCVGKRRKIRFIIFKVKNCKCEKIERSISVHCKECKSEMPNCSKMKRLGLCNKPLFRLYLCQFSCNHCEPCPKKCVTKSIGECKCEKLSGIHVCSRQIEIFTNKIINRRCIQQRSVHHSLCSCSLDYSRRKCEQLKKEGRCKEIKIMRKCQFVCTPSCQSCQGSIVHKRCEQSGEHKATFKILTVSFRRLCDSCITETNVKYSGSCLVCDKSKRYVVTDCIGDIRYVLTQYVKKERGVCVNKDSRVAFSCKECCESTTIKIGDCVKGDRRVETTFWANVNNNCKRQTEVNIYSCNSLCSTVTEVPTLCINGKQMVVKIWKSGNDCYSNLFNELRSCNPQRQ